MLVLSRRQHEKISFPNLDITVSVMRVAGKVVQLGIDAPKNIRVLREELANDQRAAKPASTKMNSQQRHGVRDRLNTAMLGVQIVQRRLESGQAAGLELLLTNTLGELQKLNEQLFEDKSALADEPAAGQHRALIVEDNANEAELLAEFLRLSGYEVQVVPDGLQAIAYLQQHAQPDVVLLDMNLPRMNGPETISSIRSQPNLSGLRLFVVSGSDRREVGVEVGSRGVDRWFTKPVNATKLVTEINRALDDECTAN